MQCFRNCTLSSLHILCCIFVQSCQSTLICFKYDVRNCRRGCQDNLTLNSTIASENDVNAINSDVATVPKLEGTGIMQNC